jgi:copper homeostasis protein
MDKSKVEVCVDSPDSALAAQSAGACRVEYCTNLPEGGTTPSLAQIEIARKLLQIKLYVLIRPRGGDFLYNDVEFEIMKSDIHHCGKAGCDGVVIGILHADGSIDKVRCKELIDIAHSYSMGVTFHRAFDRCRNLFEGMEDIIDIGCERILTSGGKNTAPEGASIIRQLIQQADNRIIIMPGSGITPENAADIIKNTGATELHGTFKSHYPSKMRYKNTDLLHQEQEYGIALADFGKIKKVVSLCR